MRSIAPPGGGGNAVPSDGVRPHTGARLDAFAELLWASDEPDWRAGIFATRKLRALGLSVVLTGPPGGRRGA